MLGCDVCASRPSNLRSLKPVHQGLTSPLCAFVCLQAPFMMTAELQLSFSTASFSGAAGSAISGLKNEMGNVAPEFKLFFKLEVEPGFTKHVTHAADVADLKQEIVAELKLNVRPTAVTLHLADVDSEGRVISVEVDALDARKSLADAGLVSGATIVVKVAPAATSASGALAASVSGPVTFPPLPPALTLKEITLACETWLETAVPRTTTGITRTAPAFFAEAQIDALRDFIRTQASSTPSVLMIVGTIKSGKSTLLREILPRLIAAEYESIWQPLRTLLHKGLHESTKWQDKRLRPVIFSYCFPLAGDAENAANDLSNALLNFARQINVPFDGEPTPGAAFDNLPRNLRKFSERIREEGGELWLLLDELQAPGLQSTPSVAARFTSKFKMVRCAASALRCPLTTHDFSRMLLLLR